jgi:hypothetical protein
LGARVAEHRAFLKHCWQAQVGSLEARREREGNLHGLVADSRAADPALAAEREPNCARLVEAIETLGNRSGW